MIYMFLSNNPSSGDINSSNLPCFFMICCLLLTFSKINFFEKFFQGCHQSVSNSLDPDQYQHSVSPDLGPDCLQRVSRKELNVINS